MARIVINNSCSRVSQNPTLPVSSSQNYGTIRKKNIFTKPKREKKTEESLKFDRNNYHSEPPPPKGSWSGPDWKMKIWGNEESVRVSSVLQPVSKTSAARQNSAQHTPFVTTRRGRVARGQRGYATVGTRGARGGGGCWGRDRRCSVQRMRHHRSRGLGVGGFWWRPAVRRGRSHRSLAFAGGGVSIPSNKAAQWKIKSIKIRYS